MHKSLEVNEYLVKAKGGGSSSCTPTYYYYSYGYYYGYYDYQFYYQLIPVVPFRAQTRRRPSSAAPHCFDG